MKKILGMCEKYDTVFSKYVFLDHSNISVFTTNPLAYPTTDRGGYEQMLLPMNNKNIRIIPIDKMRESSSYSGLYYINSVDSEVIDAIVVHFNETVGETEVYASYAANGSGWITAVREAKAFFPILILLVVSGLLALFVIAKIAISESKTIAILHVNGYTNGRIFAHIGSRFYTPVLLSLALSAAFVIAGVSAKGNLKFLLAFLAIDVFACMVLACIGAAVFLAAIKIIDHRQRKADIIKGNTAGRFLLLLQFALKYAMIAFASLLFISLSEYQTEINAYMSSNESWFQAENIFRARASFVTNDLAEKRKLELRSKELYQELEKTKDIFLMRTSNYDILSSRQYVWEANAGNGLYSSSEKSITVNLNYLKRHPVFDADGSNAADKIIADDSVRNILVPVSLKGEESKIRKGFLEDFKFQKIDVSEIYAEETGGQAAPVDESKLKINLIYVKDGIEYFTYFEQNKYPIFVKYIAGYRLIRICRVKLILEILLDILVVRVCGNFIIAAMIVATDILLTYIFSLILYKSSAIKILKGGLLS